MIGVSKKVGASMFEHIGHVNYAKRLAAQGTMKRRVLDAFMPLHVYDMLRVELKLAKVRWFASSVRKRFAGRRDLLLNIGCGGSGKDGWVNVDGFSAPGVNCVYDCRRSLPFADGSVRGIFTEHFVEHLDYTEEIPAFLSECFRVLVPGGVLRIIVPDAELYLRSYCEGGWSELEKIRGLRPDHTDKYFPNRYQTRMELVNQVFRQSYEHKYAYDFETLEKALRTFGFSNVERASFGRSQMPELAIDQEFRASESLYVEARR